MTINLVLNQMDDNFAVQYLVHTFAVCVNIFITDKYENNYPLRHKNTRHLEVVYEVADLNKNTFSVIWSRTRQ